MTRAAELLADDSKVEWVAKELGYATRHSFSREFKKHWGHPPGEHAAWVWGEAKQRGARQMAEGEHLKNIPLQRATEIATCGARLCNIQPTPTKWPI